MEGTVAGWEEMMARKAFFYGISFLLSLLLCAAVWAQSMEPTVDELSRAPLVLSATASQQLTESEWLFSRVTVVSAADSSYTTSLMPNYIVGWWKPEPEPEFDVEGNPTRPAPSPAPPPQNDDLLEAGKRYVLLTSANYHLLAVYPITGDSAYPGGLTHAQFSRRARDAREARNITEAFFASVAAGKYDDAVYWLSDALRAQAKSEKGAGNFLRKKGVIAQGRTTPQAMTLTSLGSEVAMMRVETLRREERKKVAIVDVEVKWIIRLNKKTSTMGTPYWRITTLIQGSGAGGQGSE